MHYCVVYYIGFLEAFVLWLSCAALAPGGVRCVLSGRGERLSVHILLVDDDALLRRSLTFNLEQAGYRVSSAATAEDALAIAARDRPDLVLLDIGLPGMDGLDALRHLRSQMGVPVIFVTARRRELDEVLGLELGADDYVTKPFDLDVLLARVKAVLRRSERTDLSPTFRKGQPGEWREAFKLGHKVAFRERDSEGWDF